MSLKKSITWMGLAQGATIFMQFFSTVVIARLLTPFEIGVFAAAAAVTGILGIVQFSGLNAYLVREVSISRELLASVFTLNCALSFVLFFAIITAAFLLPQSENNSGIKSILLIMSLNPLFSIFEFLPSSYLERERMFGPVAIIRFLRMASGTTCALIFAVEGFSYMSLVYGQITSSFTGMILYNIIGRNYVIFGLSVRNFKQIVRFGFEVMLSAGIGQIYARTSELLIARFLGLEVLGIYSRASGLNTMLWESLNNVLARVVFADFARISRDGIVLKQRYLAILRSMSAVLWPAFTGLAIISRPFVYNVYGAQWMGAATPLAILCLSSVIYVSIAMTWEVFVVSGATGSQLKIEFRRLAINLPSVAILSTFGIVAAACARVVDAVAANILYRRSLSNLTGATIQDLLPIYIENAVITVAAVFPAFVLMVAYDWSATVSLMYLFMAISSGVLLWFVALQFFKHPIAEEAKNIIRIVYRKAADVC